MSNNFLALAINGLVWGLIIALIALGLSIIFGLLDIINLSHGDFFMVGTVITYAVLQQTGSYLLALFLAPAIGFLLGMLIQKIVIQPIKNAASLSIVATFGLSMILQEIVRMTYGATPHRITAPISGVIDLFGIQYELYRIVAAGCSLLAIAGFFLFLKRTRAGIWMRAVRHDRNTATAMGIPTDKVYVWTFGIGFALAAFGGVVAAPITTVDFRAGVDVLPVCFMAVIIGGLGNLPGTAAAAVLLAVLEGVLSNYATPTVARIASLGLMSVVLLLRPQGLFKGLAK